MILTGIRTGSHWIPRWRNLGMNSRLPILAAVMVVSCVVPMRIAAQINSTQINRQGGSGVEAKINAAAAKPTPRAADGHPDLNGSWTYPQFDQSAHFDSDGNIYIDVPPANGGATPRTDVPLSAQLRVPVDPNPPPYKPELLAKVAKLAADEVHNDPAFHCVPLGVPRAGAPRQIVQTPTLTLLFYQIDAGIGDQPGSYRIV